MLFLVHILVIFLIGKMMLIFPEEEIMYLKKEVMIYIKQMHTDTIESILTFLVIMIAVAMSKHFMVNTVKISHVF